MKNSIKYLFTGIVFVSSWIFLWQKPAEGIFSKHKNSRLNKKSDFLLPKDTSKDTIRYPFKDNTDDPFEEPKNSPALYLNTPTNVVQETEYDPKTKSFIVRKKVGAFNYRTPSVVPFDDYVNSDFNNSTRSFWKERAQAENNARQNKVFKGLRIPGEAFDKIFGSNTIEIRPQGSAELEFGIKIDRTSNPMYTKKQQRTVNFDYNQKIQMGVTGSIGDKLKLGINYNTEATFDFENKTKIGYTGKEDEIVRSVEAGNVSLPLNGSLITGSQSLFGFKTELQFGKLTMTSIFSQQKGESQSIDIQGKAQINKFEVTADKYDANKHFFLSQYFRDMYDSALSKLPIVRSSVTITKIEVWITNKQGEFNNSRNIAAFVDLGESFNPLNPSESNIYNKSFVSSGSSPYPDNVANSLYDEMVKSYQNIRDISQVNTALKGLETSDNFKQGVDYEKLENARLLSKQDYTLNAQLGYISLNSALNNDEILAVAYEYTVNGVVHRVGEFSSEGVRPPETLIVKLLKGTNLAPKYPTWQLMMKNIYSIGAYQLNESEFVMDVLYNDVTTGNKVNYISGGEINNKVLLRVLNLDNLNSNLDPQPDGRFDFIERITINSSGGRIIFPMLEPFGSYLESKITGSDPANKELYSQVAKRYVYKELYDSTQTRAKQISEKNKFLLRGTYQSSTGSEIMLNAMNVPQGSVKVSANGVPLQEGTDYMVDYQLGRVTILNSSILESGKQIRISLENNAMYSVGTKTLIGTHLNYKFNEDFNLGATILHLNERPLTSKVNIGEEPISNTIWGLDGSFHREVPYLTKLVDKLPFLETKEKSSITFEGEFAELIPGHSRILDKKGVSFIDDFEGTKTENSQQQYYSWFLASIPQNQQTLFPEGNLTDNLAVGFNRAKLAWYGSESMQDLVRKNTAPGYVKSDGELLDPRVREFFENEIFPNKKSSTGIAASLSTLSLAFYPEERGPFNYDISGGRWSKGINFEGKLNQPETRWGGIMRKLQTTDFETANIEFIEFWLMDPYIMDQTDGVVRQASDPAVYFDLGSVSEDVMKDSRKSYENGLPKTNVVEKVDTTIWGRTSMLQQLTRSFDNNDVNSRQYQDVGLDGLSTDDERSFFSSLHPKGYAFLDSIEQKIGRTSPAYIKAYEDPSADNYRYYKSSIWDQEQTKVLDRYKMFNGTEGNSPTDKQNPEKYPTSGTISPDEEDINQDNTLNENESYFQYKVSMRPEDFVVGKNHITDMVQVKANKDGSVPVKWYQFRIPISEPDEVINGIADFKSIRFMRTLLKGFDKDVVLRMTKFSLVRGEWRKYLYDLSQAREETTIPQQESNTGFDISAVNIEENNQRPHVAYVLPPEVDRETDPYNQQSQQLNEQSLALRVTNLDDGDARACFKNTVLDVRQYGTIQMWLHAEALEQNMLNDDDLTAFIRLGTDYKENYYEYEIPLDVTQWGQYGDGDREKVWQNRLDLAFDKLLAVKQERNNKMRTAGSTITMTTPYYAMDGENRIKVVGNPNLADIRTIMLGVRNPNQKTNPFTKSDDGMSKSGELWLDELRLTDFNEKGGYAAVARLNAKLADFANITVSGNTSTPGWGSIEKKVADRSKELIYQYDISSNFELGSFFPKKYGVKIPLFFGYSEGFINPEYNPLDPDIPMSVSLSSLSKSEKKELKKLVQDYTRRKSINITNVRIQTLRDKTKKETVDEKDKKNPKLPISRKNVPSEKISNPLAISNFSLTYAYNEVFLRNINTEFNISRRYYGSFNYTYNTKAKAVTPFKSAKMFKPKAMTIFREINFNYLPTMFSFRNDLNRDYNEVQLRNLNEPTIQIKPTYKKDFTWTRVYDLKYNLTKDIKIDFNANNIARIDEPEGVMRKTESDFQHKRDSIWQNFLRGGRNTEYSHKLTINWALPIDKLPGFSWLDANLKYGAGYSWQVAPVTAVTLGNYIKNQNNIDISITANMTTIYNNVGFIKRSANRLKKKENENLIEVSYQQNNVNLKEGEPFSIHHKLKTQKDVSIQVLDSANQVVEGDLQVESDNNVSFTPTRKINNAKITVKGKIEPKFNLLQFLTDHTIQLATCLKNVNLIIGEVNSTMLPGYLGTTKYLGQKSVNGYSAPGWDFISGIQKESYPQRMIDRGLLSNDPLVNQAYKMLHRNNIRFRATLEPLNDLRIDITANRDLQRDKSEFYIYNDSTANFEARNKTYTGSFTMSANTIRTSFWKMDKKTYSSKAFDQFKANRRVIALRLAAKRKDPRYLDSMWIDPKTKEALDPNKDYPNGYGEDAQDVLIPAFLAAYSGKSPDKINLDAFPLLPALNWTIKYDGLSKLPFISKYLKSMTIYHAYASSYNKGFTSNMLYDYTGNQYDGLSYIRQAVSYQFIPEFDMQAVSITENFNPLFNVDMAWSNTLSTRFEINRSRAIALSTVSGRILEDLKTEIVVGAGFKIKDVVLNVSKKQFKSDIDMRADVAYNKNLSIIRELGDEGNDQLSSGQKNLTIKFTADYVLNSNFNLSFFYDQGITNPLVAAYKTSYVKIGFRIRFTLIPGKSQSSNNSSPGMGGNNGLLDNQP